jgi:hypothetical protein
MRGWKPVNGMADYGSMALAMKKPPRLVILGAGYAGRILYSQTAHSGDVSASSRNPSDNLPFIPENRRLEFDLAQPRTWQHVPTKADLLWCFPAAPIELVERFAVEAQLSTRRIVVLGSTSAYDMTGESSQYPPPWIDEMAPVDLGKPRVRGEEFLRQECGAVVLRVAVIYGPGRNPLDWISTGRVSPSRKYVNLIHVEDLAAVCLLALEKGTPGAVYNVSDGTPRTWDEIACMIPGSMKAATEKGGDKAGKRILTTKLTTQLGFVPRRADLLAALRELDGRGPLPQQSHDGKADEEVINGMGENPRDQAAAFLVDPSPKDAAPTDTDQADDPVAVRDAENGGADQCGGQKTKLPP